MRDFLKAQKKRWKSKSVLHVGVSHSPDRSGVSKKSRKDVQKS
jgi:hypothetical protein